MVMTRETSGTSRPMLAQLVATSTLALAGMVLVSRLRWNSPLRLLEQPDHPCLLLLTVTPRHLDHHAWVEGGPPQVLGLFLQPGRCNEMWSQPSINHPYSGNPKCSRGAHLPTEARPFCKICRLKLYLNLSPNRVYFTNYMSIF
jgi:hypothetical protein